jgi:hypothetical protein
MWLTQTYLAEPGMDFPAYAYFMFNPTPAKLASEKADRVISR